MKRTVLFVGAVIFAGILSGCGHNVHARGFYFACPYGAIGYGEASCVKGNTTVESSEEVGKDGVLRTRNTFKVGEQTTGYDVEKEKIKQKGKSK